MTSSASGASRTSAAAASAALVSRGRKFGSYTKRRARRAAVSTAAAALSEIATAMPLARTRELPRSTASTSAGSRVEPALPRRT